MEEEQARLNLFLQQMHEEVEMMKAKVAEYEGAKNRVKAPRIKLESAPKFKGRRDWGQEARIWAVEAKAFVAILGESNQAEVAYALTSHFEDFAKSWFTTKLSRGDGEWNTPGGVIREVEKEFISNIDIFQVRSALRAFKQKPRQPMANYTVEFENLATRIGDMNDGQLLHAYIEGMTGPNRNHVVRAGPKTYEDAKLRATELDNQVGWTNTLDQTRNETPGSMMDVDVGFGTTAHDQEMLSTRTEETTIQQLIASVKALQGEITAYKRQPVGGGRGRGRFEPFDLFEPLIKPFEP
jgi:hypothetical protein